MIKQFEEKTNAKISIGQKKSNAAAQEQQYRRQEAKPSILLNPMSAPSALRIFTYSQYQFSSALTLL